MEKYSNWRDKGTGIHPFIHKRTGLDWPIGLFFIKLPFIFLTACVYMASRQIGWEWIPCRVLMFLFGFTNIKEKLKINPKSGDLIIANHSSYLDSFYLTARLKATHFVLDSDNTVEFHGKKEPLKKVLKIFKRERKGPILVFPEGTTSNGLAILQFEQIISDEILLSSKIHVLGLNYGRADVRGSLCYGSVVSHFVKLCSRFGNKLNIAGTTYEHIFGDANENIANLCSKMSNLKRVGLALKDKKEFLEYFDKKNK